MTSKSYFFAKLGLSFGLNRKNHWQTKANSETALLRDAEEVFGYLCWEKCENIDHVSFEYWNIRKLMLEYQEHCENLYKAEDSLREAQNQRSETLLEVSNGDPTIVESRKRLEEEAEELLIERDEIMEEAKNLKKQHEGFKLKIDVLAKKEGRDSPKIQETNEKLREIKATFLDHKNRRAEIHEKLSKLDSQLQEADKQVSKSVVSKKTQVSNSFQKISTYNKEISTSKAKLGALEKELLDSWANLGKNLSFNAPDDPELLSIVQGEAGLANQMTALRKSIILTQSLSTEN